MAPRTLYQKVFEDHLIREADGESLIYIDRHIGASAASSVCLQSLTEHHSARGHLASSFRRFARAYMQQVPLAEYWCGQVSETLAGK